MTSIINNVTDSVTTEKTIRRAIESIDLAVRELMDLAVREAVRVEREACAAECERMVMFPGGRQESFAHHGVQEAAKAIRARGNHET